MGKLFAIIQFGLSCIIFMCVAISIIAHAVMGNITILGFLAPFFLLFLTGALVRLAWSEMRFEFKK